MRNLIFMATLAAGTIALPTAAQAQRGGIIIVDTDRVMTECTACRAATTQLQQQAQAAQQLQTSLMQPLQTELQQIQAAQKALGDKEPDAALRQRIQSFQQRYATAQQQLQQRATTLQSTEAHVRQQLGTRLVQVVEQVRARRGASVALAKDGTLANDNSIDVSGEVLTALNQALPSVSVTPLPQQQPQQPQSR